MTDPWAMDAEALIRRSAALSAPRARLRGRVLRAARQARAKKAARTGLLWAAVVFLAVGGFGAWIGSRGSSTESMAQRDSDSAEARTVIMSGVGQWDHVEAETRRREKGKRSLVDALFDHR